MRTFKLLLLVPAVVVAFASGCSSADDRGLATDTAESIEQNAKIIDTIGPNATVEGKFDPRVRAYGYVVPLKAGAKISVSLEAKGGDDALRNDKNAPLDMQLAVNAPYTSGTSRGTRVVTRDDAAAAQNAPLTFKADRDQNYLVTFLSTEDTGTGSFKLSLTCEGTDFQCERADLNKPCKQEQLFVQGATIEGDTTWDQCEVILLESATVPEGSTLTIKPGVTVKGNYIDVQNPDSAFGTVSLTVQGLLQVAGTQKAPVAFTSFKEDRGWGGIVLRSNGNSMKNVVIEKANIGIDVPNGGNVTVTDSLIQGVTLNRTRPEAGIRAQQNVEATFTRALVKGFRRGLYLANAQKMIIEDSVIRENLVGVYIEGQNPTTTCSYPPVTPARYHDPIITHSDIIENASHGVHVVGSDVLVQISKSNLVNNTGRAIAIEGSNLAPESFFRENNVFDNNQGKGQEVHSYHRRGTLDISKNYWKEISDPELSQNWRRECDGAITFTGFAPKPIEDAGPRERESLPTPVQEGCYKSAE